MPPAVAAARHRGRALSEVQHNLADITLFAKGPLGTSDVAKRKGFGDQRGDFPALNPADQISENLWLEHYAAKEAEVLEIKLPYVQFDNGTTDCPGNCKTPAAAQPVEQAGSFRAGNQIDNNVDTVGPQFGNQIIIPPQRSRGAKFEQHYGLGRARHRDNLGATGKSQLDRG